MTGDRLYLTHIIECIEKIERFTSEGQEFFQKDEKTLDAVLRNLHTLSESSTRISEEMALQNPNVAWREMAAFRNVVVHDYLGLDLDQIWHIVTVDLPALKVAIEKIFKEMN